jgi:hypothetical protein
MTTTYIDIEPTWQELCAISEKGCLPPIELMGACNIADIVRQAQKKGAVSVTFTFDANGDTEIEELYPISIVDMYKELNPVETWVCPDCGRDCSAVTCYGSLDKDEEVE